MKQVLQDVRSGVVTVAEVPEPGPRQGYVLIAVERSLISSGTERSLVELGAKSLLGKARARPDAVRKTVDVARAEGVRAAVGRVRAQLDRSLELGYSIAGRVLDTGGDERLVPGMLVSAVGAGYAVHADVVSVPRNLVIPVPADVAAEEAAFAAPAAVALHGLRLAAPQPGNTVLVIGLGLIGQLAVRVAAASGAVVVATDPRVERRVLAEAAGATSSAAPELQQEVRAASRGRGADVVLICAAGRTDEPVHIATSMARDRASIVAIGDVPLNLDRREFYEKELSLLVARSYGAGRYDRDYEEGGQDLPAGYVRWTEGRNVEAILDLLRSRRLRFDDLITERVPVADAVTAYDLIRRDGSALAVMIDYEPQERRGSRTIPYGAARAKTTHGALRMAFIGAGAFARSTLAPILARQSGVEIVGVATQSGASADSFARRFNTGRASTDWHELAASDDVDALVIATPHADHAEIASACLRAGKHVFVEKPLALNTEQLELVLDAARNSSSLLLVGHNRRFAPLAQRLREVKGPYLITIRVAAGPLGEKHWLNDAAQGGRTLGELSHFVDLATFIVGAAPTVVRASSVPNGSGSEASASLFDFEDGSAALIAYSTGQSDGLPKERVEVLGPSSTAILDDFHRFELYGDGRQTTASQKRDKGHSAQLAAFVEAARGGTPLPVSLEEQVLVSAATIAAVESAATRLDVEILVP
jgi:predicted dehydrogenase/threonine dehydrogenase-like Zn-dependent dehydrogenase